MRIESPFFTEQLKTHTQPVPFSKTFEVPPGKHTVKFSSDAQRVDAPNDPRVLVFRLLNFNIRSEEDVGKS
jgi:hypothetical protein